MHNIDVEVEKRENPLFGGVEMPKTVVDFPVFDADNHMYETPTRSRSSCPRNTTV